MNIPSRCGLAALATLFAGCGIFSDSDAAPAADSFHAAPLGETARAGGDAATGPLENFASGELELVDTTRLPAGRFVGDIVLANEGLELIGEGPGRTIIDGDLVVTTLCRARGLTVTGDVVLRGDGARVFVECQGQVLDYGTGNVH